MSKALMIKLPEFQPSVEIAASWFGERDALIGVAKEITNITTPQGFDDAGYTLKKITKTSNGLEDMRKALTAPFLQAQKTIKEAGDKAREPLELAKAALQKVMLEYTMAEQKKAAEERRLIEEAQRKAMEEEAAKRAAIEEEFGPAVEAEVEVFQPTVVAPTVHVTKSSFVNVKSQLIFEVIEASQIPRRFLKVDEAAIREWMKENDERIRTRIAETENGEGGMGFVPGINFKVESKISSR